MVPRDAQAKITLKSAMYNLDSFSKVKVLVIGDVMVDKYLWGEVTRISPEAPVPVVKLKKTSFIAGGAANVAANIAGLGATAYLIGIVGNDAEGQNFAEVLEKTDVSAEYIVKSVSRPTTVKTRIIAHNQQIARLDQESSEDPTEAEEDQLWHNFQDRAAEADILVISDYAKGVLSKNILARLIKYGRDNLKIVLIDPKGRDFSKYKGATLITPNKFEVAEVCGCSVDDTEKITRAGRELLTDLNLSAVIITRGEEGITLINKDSESITLGAVARKVYDVTGAGDTFIAALAVSIGAGNNYIDAAKIANTAAGLSVEAIGTSIVGISDIAVAIKEREEVIP